MAEFERGLGFPGEQDLQGTGMTLSVAAAALMLAIAVSLGSSSQVDLARGVLILSLACCYWLLFERTGKPLAEPR